MGLGRFVSLLQVFRLEDQMGLFTLHGHKAPVTALYLDKVSQWCRVRKGTGSQSVVVCVAKYPGGKS